MRKHKDIEKKQTHYRMWKSGKKWLYASSALALLAGGGFVVEVMDVRDDIVESTKKFFKDITTLESAYAATGNPNQVLVNPGGVDIYSVVGKNKVQLVPMNVDAESSTLYPGIIFNSGSTTVGRYKLPTLAPGEKIIKAYVYQMNHAGYTSYTSLTSFACSLDGSASVDVPFESNRRFPSGTPVVYSDVTDIIKNLKNDELNTKHFTATINGVNTRYVRNLILVTSHEDYPMSSIVINDFAVGVSASVSETAITNINISSGYKISGSSNILSSACSFDTPDRIEISMGGNKILDLTGLQYNNGVEPRGHVWNAFFSAIMPNPGLITNGGIEAKMVLTAKSGSDAYAFLIAQTEIDRVSFRQRYVDSFGNPMVSFGTIYEDTSVYGTPGTSYASYIKTPPAAPTGYGAPVMTTDDTDQLFNDNADSVRTYTYPNLPQKTNLTVVGGPTPGTTVEWLSGKTNTASSQATRTYTAPTGYHIESIIKDENGDTVTIPTILGKTTKTAVIGVTKYGAEVATDSNVQITLRGDSVASVVNYLDVTTGINPAKQTEINATTGQTVNFAAANQQVTTLKNLNYVVKTNDIPTAQIIYDGKGLPDYNVTLMHDTEVRTEVFTIKYTVNHNYTDNNLDSKEVKTVKVTRTYYWDKVTNKEVPATANMSLYALNGNKDAHPKAPAYALTAGGSDATVNAENGSLRLNTVNKETKQGWQADAASLTHAAIDLKTAQATNDINVSDTFNYTPLGQKTDLIVIGGPDAGTTDGWLTGRTGEASTSTTKLYTAPKGYHIKAITGNAGGTAGTTGDNLSYPSTPSLLMKTAELGVLAYGTNDSVDSSITITLEGDPQLATVKFIDQTDTSNIIDPVEISGKTGDMINYAKAIEELTKLTSNPKPYVVLKNTIPTAPTPYDNDDTDNQESKVTLLHDTEVKTDIYTITYKVNHDYDGDDSKDHLDTIETLVVTRTYYWDMVTNKEVPAGATLENYAVGGNASQHPEAASYTLPDGYTGDAQLNTITGDLELGIVAEDDEPGWTSDVDEVIPDVIELSQQSNTGKGNQQAVNVTEMINYEQMSHQTVLVVQGGPAADNKTHDAWLGGKTGEASASKTYHAPAGYHITSITKTEEGDEIVLPDLPSVTDKMKSADLSVKKYGVNEKTHSVITMTLAPDVQLATVDFIDKTDSSQTLPTVTIDGVTDAIIDYTSATEKLTELTSDPKHYVVLENTIPTIETRYDTNDNVNQASTVTLLHDTKVQTDTYTVTYTVTHDYAGSAEDSDTTKNLTVTRIYYVDLVTGLEVPANATLENYAFDGDINQHPAKASYALTSGQSHAVSLDVETGELELKAVDKETQANWVASKEKTSPSLIDLSQATVTNGLADIKVADTINYYRNSEVRTDTYEVDYTVDHVYSDSNWTHKTSDKLNVSRTYYWDMVSDTEIEASATFSDYAVNQVITTKPVSAIYQLISGKGTLDKISGSLTLNQVNEDGWSGWQADRANVPEKTIHLADESSTGTGKAGQVTVEDTINYQAMPYKITYLNPDGSSFTDWAGDDSLTIPTAYTVVDDVYLPDDGFVEKPGHIFLGWYETSDLSGYPVTDIQAGTTGDKVYYASWKVDQSRLEVKDIVRTVEKNTTYKWQHLDHEPVLYDEDGNVVLGAELWAIINGKVYSLTDFEQLPEGVYEVSFTTVNPDVTTHLFARALRRVGDKPLTAQAKVTILAKADEASPDKPDKPVTPPKGNLPTTGQPQTKAPLAGILPNTGEAHTLLGVLGVFVLAVLVGVFVKIRAGRRGED